MFNVPDLDVGSYQVSITVAGFATYEQRGLNLSANQVINLNATLGLATTATVTRVVAEAPTINTANAVLASTVTDKSMEQLPLVSRQHADAGFYDMMLLNTGAAQVPDNSAGAVINGTNQASGQLVAIDGIALWRNTSGDGAGEEQPSFEGAQEVHVITSNAPAEFASPVATTEVTKGGTNQFHGGAFETYNSNVLNARDFFSPGVPARVFNDFAASIGGPIQKEKTFFFFSFEGARTGGLALLTASVPPLSWRNGDFSSLLSEGVVLTNPATGAPFADNQIPSTSISSVSQKMQSVFWPQPNFGPPDLVANNYRGFFPLIPPTNWDVWNGRLDRNFGTKDVIFARFSTRKVPQRLTLYLPTVGGGLQIRNGTSSVVSWTHVFSPTLLNEFRGGYIRGRDHFYLYDVGSDLLQQFGIQGVTTTGLHNVPALNISGVTNPYAYLFTSLRIL